MTIDESTGRTSGPVLSVDGLTVALPLSGDRAEAVTDVTFQISAGDILCLVGESGSGKTVVGQAILGMLPRKLPVTSGQIQFQGVDLPPQRDSAYRKIRSAEIATIFQDATASLDPVQRIGTQLGEILEVHGVPRAERSERILDALSAVALEYPERVSRAYPHQLSGGQAQRAVIAAALLLSPKILIADEPTTALDVTTQADILAVILRLKAERGLAVLFITHDFGVVEEIADRVAVMTEGRIVEQGAAAQVLERPQDAYTRKLIAASHPGSRQTVPKDAKPILEADNVSLNYHVGGIFNRRKIAAVRGVSLNVASGRTVAIVGESGSGKSSLARCLLRLEEFDGGSIRFMGEDVSGLERTALRSFRKSVQVVLQDPYSALDPRQTVRSAIAEGPVIHGMPRAEANRKAEALLDLTGLSPQAADRYPREFSGGQLQRICIARALALEPKLLIADEPVSALDVSIQAQILELFAEMQRTLGFAMLFITHDLRVAQTISDDVLVMKQGAVVERGPTAQVLHFPSHPYTQELVASAPGGASLAPVSAI